MLTRSWIAMRTGMAAVLASGAGSQPPDPSTETLNAHAFTLIGRDEHPPEDDVAVARVLDDFHDAASRADFNRYFGHWTDESVFLGTDATERWVGQEFKDFAKPYFDKGKGWTYKPRNRHVSFSRDGSSAWFDELLDNETYGVCRGSGVLVHVGTDWRVLQYNLSFMVPNDLADKVTGLIRASAK
jgi:hypothetical protein